MLDCPGKGGIGTICTHHNTRNSKLFVFQNTSTSAFSRNKPGGVAQCGATVATVIFSRLSRLKKHIKEGVITRHGVAWSELNAVVQQ